MTTINSTSFFYNNDDPALATSSIEVNRQNTHIVLGRNLTTTPAYITISPNQISDGTNTTSLDRLCLVQQAFQSVELPPNATTLKINDTLLLDDGSSATNVVDNTKMLITGTGTFGTKTTSLDKVTMEVKEEDTTIGKYQYASIQQDNFTLYFNDPVFGGNQEVSILASTNGGLAGIQHNDNGSSPSPFSINSNQPINFSGDNISLNSSGRLVIPAVSSSNYLDLNAGRLNMVSTDTGFNSSLVIDNKNTSASASAPTTKMYKSGRNATAGEVIAQQSYSAKDSAGSETEFARMEVVSQNVSSGGNKDGTFVFKTLVNNAFNTILTLNGSSQEIEVGKAIDLNANAINTSSGNINLTATNSSGAGEVIITPKEVLGTATIKVPLTTAPSDQLVIEKSANNATFYQTGGALNTSAQMRLGSGGLRLITINPSVAPTLQLDNGSFQTATHQYSGNNYNLTLPTSLGTLSTTNVSTLSLSSPNTTITNPSGQLNINANTNVVVNGNFNTIASTSSLDIQTPSLVFTGAGLQSASSSGNSGQHLIITLNGVQYKIALQNM